MCSWVLVVVLAQVPPVESLPAPPLLQAPVEARVEPVAVGTPSSQKKPSAVTIAGLALMGAAMAAQAIDVLAWPGTRGLAATGLVIAVVPVVGSGIFALGGLGTSSSFTTRAIIFFSAQAVGAIIAAIGLVVRRDEPQPAVAVIPVSGGAVLSLSRSF